MIKYASFDVFDTCLVRATGEPDSVFCLLAQKLISGECDSDQKEFVRIRKDGEALARKKSKSEEVTLTEIYNECDFSAIVSVPNEEIMRREMEIEEEILLPVYSIKEKINQLREKKVSVSFISDIYMSDIFIRKILINAGIYKEGDGLYVSSAYMATKSSGALFNIFIKDHPKANRWNWTHYGDNFGSDYLKSLKNGARPCRIIHSFNRYENSLRFPFIPSLYFDIQRNVYIQKAVRLANNNDNVFEFAINFIAPIYVPFVWKVLTEATKKNITDLYFFARDGYILYLIAEWLKDNFKSIKLHYLYVSRKSIYFPTLPDVSEHSLRSLFPVDEKSIERILNDLYLTIDEIDDEIKTNLYAAKKRDDIISAIMTSGDMMKKIQVNYDEQKSLLLEYLVQEGMANNQQSNAIVDLRGSRKSHEHINSFLARNNYKRAYAFYFEVIEDRIKPNIKNEYYSCIYRELFKDPVIYNALRNATSIFEQYFSLTTQGRTNSYTSNGGMIHPVKEVNDISNRVKEICETNRRACKEYTYYYRLSTHPQAEVESQYALYNFLNNLSRPNRKLLRLFDGFVISENSFEKKVFLRKLKIRDAFDHSDVAWLTGCLIYTFGSWVSVFSRLRNRLKQCIISK